MPANRSNVVAKTALLAPVAPIEAWSVQQLLQGEIVTGVVGMLIGVIFIGGFVLVNEYDIPYEDEILSVLKDSDPDETAETATDVAERVGNEVEEHTEPDSNGDG